MSQLFEAVGIGFILLLPLANPLTTVALLIGLSGQMTEAERNRQGLLASIYVFAIMVVAFYGDQIFDRYRLRAAGHAFDRQPRHYRNDHHHGGDPEDRKSF